VIKCLPLNAQIQGQVVQLIARQSMTRPVRNESR
jgi:hypothetical protein